MTLDGPLMPFEEWWGRLLAEAEASGWWFDIAPKETWDPEAWRETYWVGGYTPTEALSEDASYA